MFENEVEKQSGVNDFGSGFSIECVDGKVIHVSGHKKVLSFSKTEVLLLVKKNCICVLGNQLQIKEMRKGEILIVGDIDSVKFGEKV